MKPVEYLMSHRKAILEAWQEAGNLRETYALLCGRIEGFQEAIPYNTFKVKADVLIASMEKAVCTTLYKEPQKIAGWNVTRGKDGFYRLNRRIGGKVQSIYLGKEINEKEALVKIRFKERDLEVRK